MNECQSDDPEATRNVREYIRKMAPRVKLLRKSLRQQRTEDNEEASL